MADGQHCFISYSTADALEFARKLVNKLEGGTPNIPVWFDKDNLKAGDDWDTQIDEALKTCKLILFVMSKDSVMDNSVCKQEWSRALSYKKPIVPIWLHNDIIAPFRLADRQRVDFRNNFDSGLAQLRDHLAWMDSPEGQLQEVKEQRDDAKRALNRARPEDQPRIEQQIIDFEADIKRREEIIKNPEAAVEQTKKNIETGLERERKPETPITAETHSKFINPPPGIAPNYFQDRSAETKLIADFLSNDTQRISTIVGRAGVGKTAMICRLLKALEAGHLPDDLGEHRVNGIVYLGEAGSHKVNFANIFTDLSKLLSRETATQLESLYKDPKSPVESKTFALMEAFSDGQVVLLLDNFETLIETENIRDAELKEALNAFLCGPHHTIKIIITTRIAPHDLNTCEPGRQYLLRLDEGLEYPHAENMLKGLDIDGKLSIKNAPMELLSRARVRTRGYPRALEALAGILSADFNTTLEELIIDDNVPLPEDVVKKLVGDAFSRLDSVAQKVMQALAIYNRPVTPAAIDYVLQPHIEGINSSPILQRLVNMHFGRREAGKFYLHPVDKEYAISRIPHGEEIKGEDPKTSIFLLPGTKLNHQKRNAFTQHGLLNRAADYFAQARKPRAEWKKLDDLNAQLAEFDLRCAAGDYDTAASVLTEIDFDYLLLWGHYRLMIELHDKVQEKIRDKELLRICTNNLGSASLRIGKLENAIKHYQLFLELAQKDKDKQHESAALGNLGLVYAALGDVLQAIKFHEQNLIIAREISDKRSEGNANNSLGNRYYVLGNINKAIEFYEQALLIHHEINNRVGESGALCNLGNCYLDIGNADKAIEFYSKGLIIDREVGSRYGEANDQNNIGLGLLSLGDYQKAKKILQQASQIADEILDPIVQLQARWGLTQVYLFQNDLGNARVTIEAAFQYDVPQHNHNATALHGIIALRQGEDVTARGAFLRAIGQADEILSKTADYYDALDAKGIALSGLVVSGKWEVDSERQKALDEAVETFRKARKIAPHAGVVKSVLRLFDELVKCDNEGILKDVRNAVEGKE